METVLITLLRLNRGKEIDMKAECYVDGSYIKGATEVNGAFIAIIGDKLASAMRLHTEDKSLLKHNQVSGEVFSALYVLEFFDRSLSGTDHALDELIVYHDYTGIAYWVDGTWKKTNTDMSTDYKRRAIKAVQSLANKAVKVTFKKVKAHSGIQYNELADQLAKGRVDVQLEEMYDGQLNYYMDKGRVVFVQS